MTSCASTRKGCVMAEAIRARIAPSRFTPGDDEASTFQADYPDITSRLRFPELLQELLRLHQALVLEPRATGPEDGLLPITLAMRDLRLPQERHGLAHRPRCLEQGHHPQRLERGLVVAE